MTALEMITKLRIAMGDDVEPYAVPSNTIFQWLSDAYLRIQIEFDQWKFLHQRGLIFTTTAGVAEYNTFNIREIKGSSVFCKKSTELARYPMCLYSYDDWVREEQVNAQSSGHPLYLILLPNGNYRVEPDPTEAWEIWGDIWYNPMGFTDLQDSPIWDETFHDLVVWEALKLAALEWPDNKKAARMQANLTINLPSMRRAFNYRYLETKGSAGPLM